VRNWPTLALGDLFEIARGGSPRPIDQFITDDPDGINWISISDASESSKFIKQTKRRIKASGASRSRSVKPGDFLLTNSMSFGRPYIMATTGCIHDGWLLLRPRREDIDRNYFYHLLGSDIIYSKFERLAAGATVKNLNIDLVSGVEVSLPSLPEQRRIAAILDEADVLQAKRRAALAQLDEMARAIFVEMFGDPATNPKNWPVVNIGDLVASAAYGTSEKAGAEGKIPILRMNNLTYGGALDLINLKYIDLPASQFERYTVQKGDILFNRTNSAELVGKTAVFDQDAPMAFAGYLVRLRTNAFATPEYVSAFLNSTHGKSTLRAMCKSIIGMANINAKEVQRIPIPKPPRALQGEFAERLNTLAGTRQKHRQSAREFESLFSSLQHRAFRGEL